VPSTAAPAWTGRTPALRRPSRKANAYLHDSGVSRTWLLTLAPRGTVRANVLRGMLDRPSGTRRKRVALLYRPIDPATSARIVEADRRARSSWRPHGGHGAGARRLRDEAAEQTAAEEASGAGLVEFSLMVTVTVDSDAELEDATHRAQHAPRPEPGC
jgi:hypothetical protein